MSTEVTLRLPDSVYRQAAHLAQLLNQDIGQILEGTIKAALLPVSASNGSAVKPVTELSDAEVLALTELQMSRREDRRLGKLLQRQQDGPLTEKERTELAVLLQIYREGLLRKAQAWNEAVQRGLRERLAA